MLTDFASRRALFYRQLAGLENAGIPIRQALAKVRVSGGGLPRIKAHLLESVNAGDDLGVAFAKAPGLQPFERQMAAAASRVGRLSETWTELAEYYEDKAAIRRELINQLGYPVMVIHVAIFAPAIVILFNAGLAAYLKTTLPPFLILWCLILGTLPLLRFFQGNGLVDALCWHVPFVAGVYRANVRRSALALLRAAFGAGLIADVAFASAAEACPGAKLRGELRRASQDARAGVPLTTLIEGLSSFPEEVRDAMASGAESGSLPETMAQLEKALGEEAKMRQKISFTFLGVAVFLVVAAVVGFKVVSFWTGHYAAIVGG